MTTDKGNRDRPSLDEIFAAQEASPRQVGRSKLYRWMWRNRLGLQKRFDLERPDWVALSGQFSAKGLFDRTDKPASPETARKTWFRIRQAMKKIGADAPPTRRSRFVLAKDEVAPGVRRVAAPEIPKPLPPLAGDLPPLPPLASDRPPMPLPKFRNQT